MKYDLGEQLVIQISNYQLLPCNQVFRIGFIFSAPVWVWTEHTINKALHKNMTLRVSVPLLVEGTGTIILFWFEILDVQELYWQKFGCLFCSNIVYIFRSFWLGLFEKKRKKKELYRNSWRLSPLLIFHFPKYYCFVLFMFTTTAGELFYINHFTFHFTSENIILF